VLGEGAGRRGRLRLLAVSAWKRRVVLLRLPRRVAWFYFRARRMSYARDDVWSQGSVTKPESLAGLLRLASGSRRVAEIGTGTAWTTIALALDDPAREVVSYDPIVRPERAWYLELAGVDARSRIELREAPGEAGPAALDGPFDFVFVDGSHERERTIATWRAWKHALAPGGVIAFHDWENPKYPGVTEAIRELGLSGEVFREVFVWRP
jgi:predicted O-methyltransferase YrrM